MGCTCCASCRRGLDVTRGVEGRPRAGDRAVPGSAKLAQGGWAGGAGGVWDDRGR